MPWLAAGGVASGIGAILGGNAQKKAAKQADKRLVEGRDYAINQSGLGTYRDQGVAAAGAESNLLGIGGDPAAQQEAFNSYLASSGYGTQLRAGQDAISSSAAAKGMLNSGATLKGLNRFGSGLGAQYFNTYLGQVNNVANRGANAAANLAGTVTGVATQQAQVAQNAGQAQANMYGKIGDTFGDIAGYIGGRG